MSDMHEINRLYAAIQTVREGRTSHQGYEGSYVGRELEAHYGYKVYGNGHWGLVVGHPTDQNRVLKVCFSMSDGWISYALFCMENQHENLLQVYTIRRYPSITIAEVEKLSPLCGGVRAWAVKCDRRDDFRAGLFNRRLVDERQIFLMERAIGRMDDLSFSNIMQRGSTVVLTDPYSQPFVNNPIYKIKSYESNRINAACQVLVTTETIQEKRNALARASQEAPVRSAYEDRMLFGRPIVLDHARPERLPGVVLSVRPTRPDTVRPARPAEHRGIVGHKARAADILADRDAQRKQAAAHERRRLLAKRRAGGPGTMARIDAQMVAQRRNTCSHLDGVRFRIQSDTQPMRIAAEIQRHFVNPIWRDTNVKRKIAKNLRLPPAFIRPGDQAQIPAQA